jgi:hypothetical protein
MTRQEQPTDGQLLALMEIFFKPWSPDTRLFDWVSTFRYLMIELVSMERTSVPYSPTLYLDLPAFLPFVTTCNADVMLPSWLHTDAT